MSTSRTSPSANTMRTVCAGRAITATISGATASSIATYRSVPSGAGRAGRAASRHTATRGVDRTSSALQPPSSALAGQRSLRQFRLRCVPPGCRGGRRARRRHARAAEDDRWEHLQHQPVEARDSRHTAQPTRGRRRIRSDHADHDNSSHDPAAARSTCAGETAQMWRDASGSRLRVAGAGQPWFAQERLCPAKWTLAAKTAARGTAGGSLSTSHRTAWA